MKQSLLAAMAAALLAGPIAAQQPQAPPPTPLAVGAEAPPFSLPSAGQDGVGPNLSIEDAKNQIVVLAFFFRARTGG